MLTIKLSRRADKFLVSLPKKHARQIAQRIRALAHEPDTIQSTELKGYAPWRRAKSGEYRIIYRIEDAGLFVSVVGKRNDDDVYRQIERFLK